MTDAPNGYKRLETGVLTPALTLNSRRQDPGEAVWITDGDGERFGCIARVSGSTALGSRMCCLKAKHDPDERGNPTHCGRHSEAAIAKRNSKSKARYQERANERDRLAAIRALNAEATEIVRKIASGHNDPRGICDDWVARMKSQEDGECSE